MKRSFSRAFYLGVALPILVVAGVSLAVDDAALEQIQDEVAATAEKSRGNSDKANTNQGRIQGIEADLAAEVQNRIDADSQLQANIDAEAASRVAADADLQSQIEMIELTPGPQGPPGEPGQDGRDGVDGMPGLNCWDLNENRTCDLAMEDSSGDGSCSVLDCRAVSSSPVCDGSSCGVHPPVLHHFEPNPERPVVGDVVVVHILATDDDYYVCGLLDPLTYNSEFVQLPPFSSAQLIPSIGYTVAFEPDVAGTYVLRSTVTDDTGCWTYGEIAIDVY